MEGVTKMSLFSRIHVGTIAAKAANLHLLGFAAAAVGFAKGTPGVGETQWYQV